METAPTSIEVILRPNQSQSDESSDLRGSLSPTSVYGTWQSQAVTHPLMNRARRCLTSVIEHKPLSERRIVVAEKTSKVAVVTCSVAKITFAVAKICICICIITWQYALLCYRATGVA